MERNYVTVIQQVPNTGSSRVESNAEVKRYKNTIWGTSGHLSSTRMAPVINSCQKLVIFRKYYKHAVTYDYDQYNCFLLLSHIACTQCIDAVYCYRCGVVAVSVCVCAYWTQPWVVLKRMNRSRCRLGNDSSEPKEPRVRWYACFLLFGVLLILTVIAFSMSLIVNPFTCVVVILDFIRSNVNCRLNAFVYQRMSWTVTVSQYLIIDWPV